MGDLQGVQLLKKSVGSISNLLKIITILLLFNIIFLDILP